ncbi:DUF1648 domain-containing protein [Pseudonocardia sp. TRM90224]|uniref:DUF1648 domain-containing protein n=1 Tax=Pseudonocardia sp. TRM90224 TaxID=2812678 RepID=UPI001E2B9266|nr:DUF1648 domain-containing protein [Pseudonocardia sp. TRM90224]
MKARAVLGGAPHLVAVTPAIVLLATAGARLPDPVATHFGPAGHADQFTDRWTLALITAALGVGMAAIFAVVSHRSGARWTVAASGATAGWLGAVLFACAAANLDLTDASAASLPAWTFPLAVVAAGAASLIGFAVPKAAAVAGPRSVPTMELGATEQVSWSRSVGAWWLVLLGGSLIAAGAALGVLVRPGVGLAVGVAGALAALLATGRVTVDRRGLTVAFGPFGWPRIRVAAAEIAAAEVADVKPTQFGGWGYRIVPGGRGVIFRSGEALVVTRRSGSQLTVTVDDPATAAALLGAISDRRER